MCFFKVCDFFLQISKKNTSYREKAQNNDSHENNNEGLEEQEGHTTTTTNNITNLEVNINQLAAQTNTEDITLKNDSNNDKNDNDNVNVSVNVNNNNTKNEDNEIQELEDCGRPSLLRVRTEHEWSNEMLNNYEAELKDAILNAHNSFKDNNCNISNIPDVTNLYAEVLTTNDKGENEHHESENRNVNDNINTDINTNSNQDTDYSIDTEPTRRHSSLFRVGNDEQWNESEINDYENELREQMKYLAYVTASEKQRDNSNSTTNNYDNLTYDNERLTAVTSTPSSRSQYERDGDETNKIQPQNIDFLKMKETISMENENEIRKQIEFLRQQLKPYSGDNTPGDDGKRDNYYSQYYYYYYYHQYCYPQQQEQQQEQNNQQINLEQESRS